MIIALFTFVNLIIISSSSVLQNPKCFKRFSLPQSSYSRLDDIEVKIELNCPMGENTLALLVFLNNVMVLKVTEFEMTKPNTYIFKIIGAKLPVEVVTGNTTIGITSEKDILRLASLNYQIDEPSIELQQTWGCPFSGGYVKITADVEQRTILPSELDKYTKSSWFLSPPIKILQNRFEAIVGGKEVIDGVDYIATFELTMFKKKFRNRFRLNFKISCGQIKCTRNCDCPNPAATTIFIYDAEKVEKDFITWEIIPSLINTSFVSEDHKTLYIKPEAVKEGGTILINFYYSGFKTPKSQLFKFADKIKIEEGCLGVPVQGLSEDTIFTISCRGLYSPCGSSHCSISQLNQKMNIYVLIAASVKIEGHKIEHRTRLNAGFPVKLKLICYDKNYSNATTTIQIGVLSKRSGQNLEAYVDELVLGDTIHSLGTLVSQSPINKDDVMLSAFNAIDTITQTQMKPAKKKHLLSHLSQSLLLLRPEKAEEALQLYSLVEFLNKVRDYSDVTTGKNIGKLLLRVTDVFEFNRAYPEALRMDLMGQILNFSGRVLESSNKTRGLGDKKVRDDLSEMTDYIMKCMSIAVKLGTYNLPGESSEMNNRVTKFITERLLPEDLDKDFIGLGNDSSGVSLGPDIKKIFQESNGSLEYQLGIMVDNPYWFEKGSESINTDVVTFDLKSHGRPLANKNVEVGLVLRARKVPIGTIRGTVDAENLIGIHRFVIKKNSALLLTFRENSIGYQLTTSDCFCEYEDFVKGKTISNSSTQVERTLTLFGSEKDEIVYICISKNEYKPVDYEADFAAFSCVRRDTDRGKWDPSTCRVKHASLANNSYLRCECTHLSIFAGEIFVPPNNINLVVDIDFEIFFVKNWLMLVFVVSMLIVCLLLFFWAFLKDRRFRQDNFVCPLKDNYPGDSYLYLIVVFTGAFLDAGTTADVAFQIEGEQSSSRVHLFKCCCHKVLQRNSQDWFLMFAPIHLGKIKSLNIWHNTRGSKPHWYCQKIVIEDMSSGEQYFFLVEKWFSLLWGNGRINYSLKPICLSEFIPRKVLLRVKLDSNFRDKHIWLSLFTRDAQSNFTTKERVGSAFAGIFLSMLASAMFYDIPTGQSEDSIDTRFRLTVTVSDLAIFFESMIVTLPASFLILIIFRNSQPDRRKVFNRWVPKIDEESKEQIKKPEKKVRFIKLDSAFINS